MVLGASTYTFGLGFAVRAGDGLAPLPGSAGDFNWGGYAGTFFWVDPKEQRVATLMVHRPARCALSTEADLAA
jgi:CubicO group peptidase (beta-lactamase class C family)